MLMVVLGAGASYDSIPALPPKKQDQAAAAGAYRPPLSDELFADREPFSTVLANYPQCHPIIPFLRHLENASVEEILEELQNEGKQYPARVQQLAAVRYYLHHLLWVCDSAWIGHSLGITNYRTLLDEIELHRKPDEQVCIVTFNYDRLIEAALPTVGVEITDLNAYISHPHYKLIKLHGSVNWARRVANPMTNLGRNAMPIAQEIITLAPYLTITDEYRMVTQYPIATDGVHALFPAISIPIQGARDFECPAEHLKALREFIPRMDTLVLVGWSATQTAFLQLLRENLRQQVRGLIVAGSTEEAARVAYSLDAQGLKLNFYYTGGGFSDFIVSREYRKFVRSLQEEPATARA
jgi:hypothetical protein